MEAIAVLISTHSSNDPSLLYAKAQDLRLGPGDNLKDYLENHIELRDQLTAANYPGITSDVFAIDFILSGITDPRFSRVAAQAALNPELKTNLTKLITYL